MRTYSLEDLRPGMKVVFVDVELNDPASFVDAPAESNADFLAGRLAMVVATTDKPGKTVALAFKDPILGGHSCDGLVPEGHGWWALPEHLYSEESWEQHKEENAKAIETRRNVNSLLAGFINE